MRFRSVAVIAVALLFAAGAFFAPALAQPAPQVIHSVSGSAAYASTAAWAGTFLFSAVMRADGTVSGRVVYEDGVMGGTTEGVVTHMNVVGKMATVFAQLPPDFICAMCGDAHPSHFFFVVSEGTGRQPDQIGWPFWFVHWETGGHNYTVQEIMAMKPKELLAWMANWPWFEPPLLDIVGHVQVR
jgi:hypothetical protein